MVAVAPQLHEAAPWSSSSGLTTERVQYPYQKIIKSPSDLDVVVCIIAIYSALHLKWYILGDTRCAMNKIFLMIVRINIYVLQYPLLHCLQELWFIVHTKLLL